MAEIETESELKLLLKGTAPQGGVLLNQVYLPSWALALSNLVLRRVFGSGFEEGRIRVSTPPGRIIPDRATLDFKGRPGSEVETEALDRLELTFRVPAILCGGLVRLPFRARVQKRRVRFGPWEIDVFLGRLSGLIMGEVEDPRLEEGRLPDLPPGLRVVRDVTHDPVFQNRNLARLDGSSLSSSHVGE